MSLAFTLTPTLSLVGRGGDLSGFLPWRPQDVPLPAGERVRVRGPMRQSALQTARARKLRQDQTEAEKRLWYVLRARRFLGLKFRRQAPVGPFIVDFLCKERRLVIEADGGQHADNPRDRARDQWLEDNGYTVLRFWNSDILTNLSGVLAHIKDEVAP